MGQLENETIAAGTFESPRARRRDSLEFGARDALESRRRGVRMGVRSPIPELLEFLSVYEEKIVALALDVRRFVLTESPRATETIYDAYNVVAVGYSFTGRLKESFCHVAVYAKHVNLGFNHGAELADPRGILQGNGKQIRHVTIREAADLKSADLTRLLRLAIKQSKELAASSKIPEIAPQSIVKAVYAKRRRPGGASL